jgi:sugar lactone lactonase YvrE
LFYPNGIVVDAEGNLLIADQSNNRIRKVDSRGYITTFAGSQEAGYSGDGGMAVSALLSAPSSLALDLSGNLYIADQGNNCVRMISRKGYITTFAGSGTYGYAGDGGDALAATFNVPMSVATDNKGNVYIADQGNHCIRKVDAAHRMSTIAGNGKDGNKANGIPATNAELSLPTGVAADHYGNVYVAEPVNGTIRKITPDGRIFTIAGNGVNAYGGDGGQATDAALFMPWSIAIDESGNLYIADQNNNRVRKVGPTGVISTVAGRGRAGYAGDGGCATDAEMGYPWNVTVDAKGTLYIADWGLNCVRKVENRPCGKNAGARKRMFTLVPRPSQDQIDIQQTEPADYDAEVSVLDVSGKLLSKGVLQFRSGRAALNANNLPTGIYTVEITDDKGNKESFKVFLEN